MIGKITGLSIKVTLRDIVMVAPSGERLGIGIGKKAMRPETREAQGRYWPQALDPF
jgi:hypothetical protein